MNNIEEFAKLLSSDVALMKKCVEANFDAETLKKLGRENGFDFSTEELAPFAASASAVMKKAKGETLTDDEKEIISHLEAKAKEMKLPDEALAVIVGGQKEGYDTPTSVGKVDGGQYGGQWFPEAFLAAIAAASAVVALVAAVAVDVAVSRK